MMTDCVNIDGLDCKLNLDDKFCDSLCEDYDPRNTNFHMELYEVIKDHEQFQKDSHVDPIVSQLSQTIKYGRVLDARFMIDLILDICKKNRRLKDEIIEYKKRWI